MAGQKIPTQSGRSLLLLLSAVTEKRSRALKGLKRVPVNEIFPKNCHESFFLVAFSYERKSEGYSKNR